MIPKESGLNPLFMIIKLWKLINTWPEHNSLNKHNNVYMYCTHVSRNMYILETKYDNYKNKQQQQNNNNKFSYLYCVKSHDLLIFYQIYYLLQTISLLVR